MPEPTPDEPSILDALIAWGLVDVQYQLGVRLIALSDNGALAAAVLYNMLSEDAKASIPHVEFSRYGQRAHAKRERRRARRSETRR